MVVRGSSKEKTWPDVIWEITEDITEDTPALNNLSAQPQSLRWAFSGTTLNFQQQGLNILSKANMNNFNIPLVFHGQELMDLWKSAMQTVMYSKGRTALILATLVFHPGGFKITQLQGWNQGLMGVAGEKFSGKTFSGQISNARLLSEDCRYGKVCWFKKPYQK